MTLLKPADAQALIGRGAVPIDIRTPDEFARSRLPGAVNVPLDRLDGLARIEAPALLLHCRSGARTAAHLPRLEAAARCPVHVLEGGLDAWRRAGLPVEADPGAPLELMRQVQLVAGALILLGVGLGLLVAPAWFGLAAFVGAGLMTAGATGWCGMARLLATLPWNRPALRPRG